jgi:hypothetical protein
MQKVCQILGITNAVEKKLTQQAIISVQEAQQAMKIDPADITVDIADRIKNVEKNILQVSDQVKEIAKQTKRRTTTFNGESSTQQAQVIGTSSSNGESSTQQAQVIGTSFSDEESSTQQAQVIDTSFANEESSTQQAQVIDTPSSSVNFDDTDLTNHLQAAKAAFADIAAETQMIQMNVSKVREIISGKSDDDGNMIIVSGFDRLRIAIRNVTAVKAHIIKREGVLKAIQNELPKVFQKGLGDAFQNQLPGILQGQLRAILLEPLTNALQNYQPNGLRRRLLFNISNIFKLRSKPEKLLETLQEKVLRVFSKELSNMIKDPLLHALREKLVDVLQNRPLASLEREMHTRLKSKLLEELNNQAQFVDLQRKLQEKFLELLRKEDILNTMQHDVLNPFLEELHITFQPELFTALWNKLSETLQKKLPKMFQNKIARWDTLLNTLRDAEIKRQEIDITLQPIEDIINGGDGKESIVSFSRKLADDIAALDQTNTRINKAKSRPHLKEFLPGSLLVINRKIEEISPTIIEVDVEFSPLPILANTLINRAARLKFTIDTLKNTRDLKFQK